MNLASRLESRLAEFPPAAATLLVLDLDGTLHAGRFGWGRGLSNIDLAYEIGWLLRPFGLPMPPPVWTARVALFRLAERRLHRQLGQVGEYYAGVIARYRRDLLAACPARIVAEAARAVARHPQAGVAAALRLFAPRVAGGLVLSKAFDPVVAAYVDFINEEAGIRTVGIGNPTAVGAPTPHLTGADKAASLLAHLAAHPGITAAIVAGDTRHDLPMADAARRTLGARQVLFLAIAPKDDVIAAAADLVVPAWTALLSPDAPAPPGTFPYS